jgi:outer membrane protein assembly factor BamB
MKSLIRLIVIFVILIFFISNFSNISFSINQHINKIEIYDNYVRELYPQEINSSFNDSIFMDINNKFNRAIVGNNYLAYNEEYLYNNKDPWPMKCHDRNHSSRSPFNTSHIIELEKWRVQSGSWVKAGMAIDKNNIIYYGDFQYDLTAVYPDGTIKWRYPTQGRVWSTPTIADNGTIYCSSYDDRLYALNYNGTLKWKTLLGGSSSTSPIIDENGIIYVGTMTGDESIVAVNPNGSIRWKYKTNNVVIGDITIGPDGTIYAGSYDSNFYALFPNGTLKWKYKTGDAVKGPASIAFDGTIYIGSWDGYLYALYPENGSLRWRCDVGGTETNPSIAVDGTIYVGNQGLYAIYPNNGTIKWNYAESGRSIFQSSPAISADEIIYVGANINNGNGGEIWAINSDGTLKWKKWIANEFVDSSPAIAQDGTIYISSASQKRNSIQGVKSIGYLHAFGPIDSNTPPDKPSISGENLGNVGETYLYEITSNDDENNPLSFYIEWGDGTTTDWSEEAASGEIVKFIHTYDKGGKYTIRAKARDTLGEESDWGTLTVRMPLSYQNHGLQWFQNQFPILAKILNLIKP